MEHEIKVLKETITNHKVAEMIASDVKELRFENNHLTIYVDNAHVLHELSTEENDHHLQSALNKIYGEDITYEVKLMKGDGMHEREKTVPHNIR